MIDGGLRKLFIKHLPAVHWQAIETWITGAGGVPDLNGCKSGVEFWIECKQTKTDRVKLRPEQVGWIEKRMRNGGRCFVAVRQHWPASARKAPCDRLWLLSGLAARPLASGSGLASLTGTFVLGSWHNGPAAWDWPVIGLKLR